MLGEEQPLRPLIIGDVDWKFEILGDGVHLADQAAAAETVRSGGAWE